jgi:hypothetical protein
MVWIEVEAFWLVCPAFADELIGRQAFEGFQSAAEIVGVDEVLEVGFELVMAVIMIAFDGCFLDCPVHPFDLTIGPGMFDFGEAVLNVILFADSVKDVFERTSVVSHVGELDAIIGQDRMDTIGNSKHEIAQKLSCNYLASLLV